MNLWLATAVVLVLGVAICGYVACRGRKITEALVGLQAAGVFTVAILMLMAEAFQRPSFFDMALALMLVSLPGILVYAYFIERWFR